MKRIIVVGMAIFVLVLCSCTHMSITTPNGSISQTSLFATADSNDARVGKARVKIGKQTISLEALQAFLKIFGSVPLAAGEPDEP